MVCAYVSVCVSRAWSSGLVVCAYVSVCVSRAWSSGLVVDMVRGLVV